MKLNPETDAQIRADRKQMFDEFPPFEHPKPPPMFSKRFKEFVLVGLMVAFVFTVLKYWR